MSDRTEHRPGQDGFRLRGLDRQMLVLTVALWLFNLVMLTFGSAVAGWGLGETGVPAARLVSTASGITACYTLYLLLKRLKTPNVLLRFVAAALGAAAAAMIVTLVDLSAFWRFTTMGAKMVFAPAMIIGTYTVFLWLFLAWAALYASMFYAAELRERDRRLAKAESAAQKAQLAALRLQIHPHFLFNTLNTLSGLVGLGRQEAAEQMILNLSAVLRRTLATSPEQLTTLDEELEVQLMYLAIEQARFPDRLRVCCDIEPCARPALTPSLILQPLVENAVKHSLAMSEGPVQVTISARREADRLEVTVADTGGSDGAANPGFGIGLRNVRERLAALFGERADFTAGPEGAGWVNRLSLPWMVG